MRTMYLIHEARVNNMQIVGVAISFSRALPNPGIKLVSPALAGGFFATEPPTELNEYSGEILEYILSSTELRTLTYKWVEISTI